MIFDRIENLEIENQIFVPVNYADNESPIRKDSRKININILSVTGDKEILNCVKILV
jgi:hypothetical protein